MGRLQSLPAFRGWPLAQDLEGKLAVTPDSRVPPGTATPSRVSPGAQLLICEMDVVGALVIG